MKNDRPDLDDLLAEASFARRLALALTGNPAEADDVVQEALVTGTEHPPHVRTTLRGWLAGTVRNLVLLKRRTEGRRARREQAAARPEGQPSAADAAARAEMLERVSRALQALPEPYRAALIHRYYDGLPPREIAARNGVPVTTVKTWLRRGLARLRSDLDRERGGRARWTLLLFPRAECLGRRPGTAIATRSTIPNLLPLKGALLATALLAVAGILVLPSLVDWSWHAATPPGAPRPESTEGVVARAGHADGPGGEAPVASREELPGPVDLAAADRDRDIFGRVVDGSGRPVAGARVVAVERPWRRCRLLTNRSGIRIVASTVSSSDGSFLLSLARGQLVELRAAAGSFAETILPDLQAGTRVEVVLYPGADAVVEVADERGRPVPGTRIVLWREANGAHPIVRRDGVTDEDGRCRFAGLTPGPVLVKAIHPVLVDPGRLSSEVPEAGHLLVAIDLERGRTLSGRVLDAETGRPIHDAVVGEGWDQERGIRTDETGAFVFHSGRHESCLTAAAAGYGAREVTVPATADAPLEIRLSRADALAGRVVDSRGEPIAGARVAAMGSLHRNGIQSIDAKSAETGPDGRFDLADLRCDLGHTLIVQADGQGKSFFEFEPAEGGPGRIDMGDLVLPEPGTIEGQVVDENGTPQPGVLVELRDPGVRNLGSYYGSELRRTDDRGRFRFPELAPGRYALRAIISRSQCFEKEVVLPVAGVHVEVVLDAPKAGNLVVRVTDEDGHPLSGVTIDAGAGENSSGPPQTGEDGRARLVGLPRRPLELRVHPRRAMGGTGPRFLPTAIGPVVPDGREIDVVLERAAEIRGRVLAPDGEPAACMVVTAFADGKRFGRCQADGDGEFVLHVRRGSSLRLRVDGRSRPRGFAGPVVLLPFEGDIAEVEAPAAGVEIRTRELLPDRSLTVRVLDRTGRPVRGALVRIPPDDEHPIGAGEGLMKRTGPDGIASFSGLTPQVRRVTVSRGKAVDLAADAAIPEPTRVVPADQTVTVSFRPGVVFTGTVRDAEGRPVAGAEVDLFRLRGKRLDETRTDGSGRFRLVGLPGERHQIFAGYVTESKVVRRTLLSDLGAGASGLTLVPR